MEYMDFRLDILNYNWWIIMNGLDNIKPDYMELFLVEKKNWKKVNWTGDTVNFIYGINGIINMLSWPLWW